MRHILTGNAQNQNVYIFFTFNLDFDPVSFAVFFAVDLMHFLRRINEEVIIDK